MNLTTQFDDALMQLQKEMRKQAIFIALIILCLAVLCTLFINLLSAAALMGVHPASLAGWYKTGAWLTGFMAVIWIARNYASLDCHVQVKLPEDISWYEIVQDDNGAWNTYRVRQLYIKKIGFQYGFVTAYCSDESCPTPTNNLGEAHLYMEGPTSLFRGYQPRAMLFITPAHKQLYIQFRRRVSNLRLFTRL